MFLNTKKNKHLPYVLEFDNTIYILIQYTIYKLLLEKKMITFKNNFLQDTLLYKTSSIFEILKLLYSTAAWWKTAIWYFIKSI